MKCTCGRPAAKYPGLLFWLFRHAKAEVQRRAAWAHKCVDCYKIDLDIALYLAARKPRRTDDQNESSFAGETLTRTPLAQAERDRRSIS